MKRFLILFCSLICSFTLLAQDENPAPEWNEKGDMTYGISIGYASTIISEDAFGLDELLDDRAFIASFSFDYFFSKTWSLRTRLNYESRFDDNFLSIPVMANWHFGKRKRWNLHFGLLYAMNLNNNSFLESGLGTDIGIGYSLPVGNTRIFFEMDGATDIKDVPLVITDQNGNPVHDGELYLNRTALNIGIMF